MHSISIHSLRVEGDFNSIAVKFLYYRFQSTPSVWRETLQMLDGTGAIPISIHSLRVEGDTHANMDILNATISIHSLRVEGDVRASASGKASHGFQSTPSVWRETIQQRLSSATRWNFNPLPPCGGRPFGSSGLPFLSHFNPLPPCGGRHRSAVGAVRTGGISIHSLRVEGDKDVKIVLLAASYFNPLPPCGGRLLCRIVAFG